MACTSKRLITNGGFLGEWGEVGALAPPPRSDYEIFLTVGIDRQPLMIIEYKQQTNTDVGSVSCADMAELFLHGYYILKKQQLSSILLCLTSLSVWHVFYVSMLPSAVHLVMSVNLHFKLDNNTWPPDLQQTEVLVLSLVQVLKDRY